MADGSQAELVLLHVKVWVKVSACRREGRREERKIMKENRRINTDG
jgi:hypothetical protein